MILKVDDGNILPSDISFITTGFEVATTRPFIPLVLICALTVSDPSVKKSATGPTVKVPVFEFIRKDPDCGNGKSATLELLL
jgi:hypothetical protein